jgi:hypothetical protein
MSSTGSKDEKEEKKSKKLKWEDVLSLLEQQKGK